MFPLKMPWEQTETLQNIKSQKTLPFKIIKSLRFNYIIESNKENTAILNLLANSIRRLFLKAARKGCTITEAITVTVSKMCYSCLLNQYKMV